MTRRTVVALAALLLLIPTLLLGNAVASPTDACESAYTSPMDSTAKLKAYVDCREDRQDAALRRIEAELGITPPSTSPSATPTSSPAPTITPRPTATVTPSTTPTLDPGVIPVWGAPVWRTEFDAASDLSKWNVRDRDDLGLLFDTGEVQREAVTVSDGKAKIAATWKATPKNEGPQGILTHDTGYLDHRKAGGGFHFSQEFGRWEARVKTPTGLDTRGTLAAFWLRADSKPGEIDIMEAWGYGGTMSSTFDTYVKDSATTTVHSSTNSATVNGKPYRKTFWRHHEHGGPRPMHTEFHTYALEYTPTYMAGFVDGKQLYRVTPASPDPVNGGTLAWLWDPDFFGSTKHMRINLHMGPSPTYWGLPDPNNRQWTARTVYEIDHVRVYALPRV